jgi:hypothetical protein
VKAETMRAVTMRSHGALVTVMAGGRYILMFDLGGRGDGRDRSCSTARQRGDR